MSISPSSSARRQLKSIPIGSHSFSNALLGLPLQSAYRNLAASRLQNPLRLLATLRFALPKSVVMRTIDLQSFAPAAAIFQTKQEPPDACCIH